MDFQLGEANTEVEARLSVRRNPDAQVNPDGGAIPLVLDGEDLTLLAICMNGQRLPEPRYTADEESLTIHEVPERFTLEIITRIQPEKNTALEGLYVSNHIFCTQCEAEGFRKITYFLDRPDVMARYRTRIEADKATYPVLLANGNRVDGGERPGGAPLCRLGGSVPEARLPLRPGRRRPCAPGGQLHHEIRAGRVAPDLCRARADRQM